MSLESILKKYPRPSSRPVPAPAPTDEPPQPNTTTSSTDETRRRNLQIALHHANIIQQTKDTEAENFAALEELIDFPQSSSGTASHPSQTDVERFRKLISSFQVADFDALLEERHAAKKCAYAFCPRPCHSSGGGLKLVWTKREMHTVPREKVDIWCSTECKKRAMHIKVQLSDVPVYERSGPGNIIDVIGEDPTALSTADVDKAMADLSLSKAAAKHQDSAELATERGDAVSSARAAGFAGQVWDKQVSTTPRPPSPEPTGMDIDGYTPQRNYYSRRQATSSRPSSDEEGDVDWELC